VSDVTLFSAAFEVDVRERDWKRITRVIDRQARAHRHFRLASILAITVCRIFLRRKRDLGEGYHELYPLGSVYNVVCSSEVVCIFEITCVGHVRLKDRVLYDWAATLPQQGGVHA